MFSSDKARCFLACTEQVTVLKKNKLATAVKHDFYSITLIQDYWLHLELLSLRVHLHVTLWTDMSFFCQCSETAKNEKHILIVQSLSYESCWETGEISRCTTLLAQFPSFWVTENVGRVCLNLSDKDSVDWDSSYCMEGCRNISWEEIDPSVWLCSPSNITDTEHYESCRTWKKL